MKKSGIKFFGLAMALFISFTSFGQGHRQGGQAGGERPSGGAIKARVLDASTGTPIEYANLVVYSAKDSSLVSGGITDATGNALIRPLPFGQYYMTVDFIGYIKHTENNLKINQKQPFVDLGTVNLKQATEILDDVTIEADRKHIEYKIDKKIVNVSQDIGSQGGSAVDVLENTPSVQTDIEGNVMLRGSSSFTVLIDGKPTPLEGSEALQQIPASSIENIEIITNPSAKFDPDGVAGIINIVLKQEEKKGINGNVNLAYGSFNAFNGDFLINARTGKFNFFVGGNYSDRVREGTNESLSARFLGDSTFVTDVDGTGSWGHNGYNARAGLDYFMTDKDIITVSGEYGVRGFSRGGTSDNTLFYSDAEDKPFTNAISDPWYYSNDVSFDVNNQYYSGDLNYQHKFNNEGHDLQAYFMYSGSLKDETSGFNRFDTDADFNAIDGAREVREQSVETGNTGRMRAKIDYTNPFSENGKFEAGYQFRNRIGLSDYKYEIWNGTNYVYDTTQFNDVDFNRQIHASYATFTNQLWKFDYMLGVRGEYTKRDFTSNVLNKSWNYEKFDAFPTVHVSRKLKYEIQLQASYTSRIRRPRSWFLDPFRSKMDEYNYREGNPGLEPAYINSFEFNAQKRFGSHFLALESFYRQTNNLFERITYVDPTNSEVLIYTFDNVGQDESYGVEVMGNFNFAKWWNMNLTADMYQYTIDADMDNSSTGENSTLTYSARINNTFKIKKTNTRFQLFGMYNGPSITSQGERGEFFMINAAVRQEFMNRKLSVMFSVDDIFGTMKHSSESYTDSFYNYSSFDAISPTFRITLSYRINDYERRKEDRESIEVEGGDGMM